VLAIQGASDAELKSMGVGFRTPVLVSDLLVFSAKW
jgi:hypothetical protein